MDISYQQQRQSWFSYSSPPSYSLGQRTAKPCKRRWRSTWLRKLSSLRPWSSCPLYSPRDCPSDSQMDSPETLHVLINVLPIHSRFNLQLTDSCFKDDLADSSARMVVRFHRLPVTSFVTSRHEPDVLRLVRDPVPVRVEVERFKWKQATVLRSSA